VLVRLDSNGFKITNETDLAKLLLTQRETQLQGTEATQGLFQRVCCGRLTRGFASSFEAGGMRTHR